MPELKTTFQLAEAPRHVPPSLRMKMYLGGLGQVGWLIVALGVVFGWLLGSAADWRGPLYFRGELGHADGHIRHLERTHYSVGGGEHSDGTPVYAYTCVFEHDGQPYEVVSYTTGRGPGVDASVEVEFPAGRPALARVVGMRHAPFSIFVVLVWIVPLVGVWLIVHRARKGGRGIRILENGRPAQGQLVDKKRTNVRVNKQYVYKFTYAYQADDGSTHQCAARTHKVDKLEGEYATLLYDPRDPSQAVVFNTLPGTPETDETGQFKPAAGAGVLVVLPALAAGATATMTYLWFGVA